MSSTQITSELLAKIAPGTPRAKRDRFIPYYNECLPRYGINDRLEVAAFLTTVCFESDYFKALAEYADGWAYDITRNRKKALELGNIDPGDGPKYKGAGGIETTGKKNYRRLSDRLGVDFVAHPEWLRTEKYFVEAACVFWDDNHFNELANDGEITKIENITNRGSGNKTAKALADRLKIYKTVLAVLPKDFELSSESSPTTQTGSAEPNAPEGPAKESAVEPGAGAEAGVPDTEDAPAPPATVKRSLWDRATDWQGKLDKVNSFKDSLSPISGSSKFTVILTKLGGWAMMLLGLFADHWLWIVLGVVLVALAIWYLSKSKDRAAGRSGNAPAEQTQSQTIVVKK